MKPTLIRLDDDLAASVEAWRVEHGLKSSADAMRRLMVLGLGAQERVEPVSPPVSMPAPAKAVRRVVKSSAVKVDASPSQAMEAVPFGPVPRKPGVGLKKR